MLEAAASSFWRHFRHAPQRRWNKTQTETCPSPLRLPLPPTLWADASGRGQVTIHLRVQPEALRRNLRTWQEKVSDGSGSRLRRSSTHCLPRFSRPAGKGGLKRSCRSGSSRWTGLDLEVSGKGTLCASRNVPYTPVPETISRGDTEAWLHKAFARGRSEAGGRMAWPGSDQAFSNVMTAGWLMSLLGEGTAPSSSPDPRKPHRTCCDKAGLADGPCLGTWKAGLCASWAMATLGRCPPKRLQRVAGPRRGPALREPDRVLLHDTHTSPVLVSHPPRSPAVGTTVTRGG